jgi:hypothetical protein
MCTLHIRQSTSSANHQISLSLFFLDDKFEKSIAPRYKTSNSPGSNATNILWDYNRMHNEQTSPNNCPHNRKKKKKLIWWNYTWESDNPSRRTAMMASAIVSGLQVLKGPRSRKRKFCMTPWPVAQAFCHSACNWYWYVSVTAAHAPKSF